MNQSQRSILIISAFDRLNFPNTGLLPSDRMLIEMIRPGTDPTLVTLNFCDAYEFAPIPDLDSQLILKKWSNSILSKVLEIQNIEGHFIDKLCWEQNKNNQEARYHYAVFMYIGALFPPRVQNLENLSNASIQMTNVYVQYQKGNVLAIGKELEDLVGFDFMQFQEKILIIVFMIAVLSTKSKPQTICFTLFFR